MNEFELDLNIYIYFQFYFSLVNENLVTNHFYLL